MRIRFICDCCDRIFDEDEVQSHERRSLLEALTEEFDHDIILHDHVGPEVYLPATCEECSAELGLDDSDDLAFYREPLLN